jgi:uncharacterized RmlC-like cupin family protein
VNLVVDAQLIQQLADGIRACRPPDRRWNRGNLSPELLDLLDKAAIPQLDVDLRFAIERKLLAYASPDDLTYPDSASSAEALWRDGRTAIMQSLHASPGLVNSVCAVMEVAESKRVSCSAYVAAPRAQTFELHTDDWDAFIIQLRGNKHFWLETNGSNALAGADLCPGDTLYIPRLLKHRAYTDSGSIHLSINLLAWPPREVLNL